ncbi:MAG: hypothetical protein Q9209_004912 [Squamulea sp. 1 TL-2023]
MPSSDNLLDTAQHGFRILRPMLPTYLHLLVSALSLIYAGAHASLTRPSSAAKPTKSKKKKSIGKPVEDEPEDEIESRIEALAASDAIWLPLLAGCTLSVLYIIIKWLEDPALLNTVLNWYFAIFGIYGVAKLFNDSLNVLISYAFPSRYHYANQIWVFDTSKRVAVPQTEPSCKKKQSPLPGRLSELPLTLFFTRSIWDLRSSHSNLCIRSNLHRHGKAHFHVTSITILSSFLALIIVFYYNLVSRPWYLTNILGFAFAYNALQLISPNTTWTGTLILGTLFLYDIYFVFFTPLMVTVATQLDIPAKLLFPRPSDPDSTKQRLSMLGLGDVVLPGMMIGFALRLDLYLHYLRKQTSRPLLESQNTSSNPKEGSQDSPNPNNSRSSREVSAPTTILSVEEARASSSNDAPNPSAPKSLTKPRFHPATGNWGTRFWTSSSDPIIQGVLFPKPYFHASLFGYVVGMMMTLGIMQFTGHAQPALFYLVPCVLGSFWGRAVLRGEVKEVWNFNEGEEKAEEAAKKKSEAKAEKENEEEKSKQDDEKVRTANEVRNDQTEKKVARKRSAKRKTKSSWGGDFLEMNLKIGFTKSKGTKNCNLAKRTGPKGRKPKQDAPKEEFTAPSGGLENVQTKDVQDPELSKTESSKSDSFELLATEEGTEGDVKG